MSLLNVLFIGDIIGKPGRRSVLKLLPSLKAEKNVALTIANCENAAGGFGLTPETLSELFDSGIDVVTTGNHIWDKRDIVPCFETRANLLRPLNYPDGVPGKGAARIDNVAEKPVWVVNLQGKIMMPPVACPFMAMDSFLRTLPSDEKIVIVDFHAEATSEKRAMGFYLDGRASLVLGTHTHVPTRDAEILPKGTGYITDVGMTGPKDSVIGMKKEGSIQRLLTGMPVLLEVAKGDPVLSAVFASIERSTGRCAEIEQVILEG